MRQGGIISTDFCNINLNPLLCRIQYSGLRAWIYDLIYNLIRYADDLAMDTNDRREGQTLVNSSTDFADIERYFIRADNSVALTVTPKDNKNDVTCT